ncbi:NAD(P)-dependent alcohol dehydrogenase [Acidocella aminolytica]|uniref:Alcohol dehydrogenase n=1 Tax=Acidocella aminolytica 101 = DSM 11237 TaxID=1120923 RepID=A0A0D6PD94_9PROT|nr:NAD(P)-dependent alcohol dehydrogenase [Acidocella aminolytica]GAN78844.1 alcohol dehydrogenase [Acidocella aminolytica 101 = DSM 11237]GBQ33236.1 zinc-dependent alcohol dehydrogenase [Acidocella aminolytica 101 = DSM 11237]SHF17297.1 aryl-alcohol dehydrogenase [Acidocella aminolytica 101 = DSM 11237]
MHIQAAVTREKGGKFLLETLSLESPRADELLIRITAVGICHTDLAMRDQVFPVPQPIVLGHEGAGIVEQVGADVTGFAVGDKVVMSYRACGACPSCAAHAPSYCHAFFPLNFGGARADGSTALSCDSGAVHSHFFGQSSFASHVVAHHTNVVKVAAEADLAVLAPFGCGIQTGAGAVINALKVGVGESIAIFGTGSVGLSAVMAAKLVGATRIIAVDRNAERLALAQELGATHIVNAGSENPVEAIQQITGPGVAYAIDTTALIPVLSQALAALAPRGTLGIIGASRPDEVLPVPVIDLLTSGKHVRGIVEGDAEPSVFLPKLIELHAQGRFPAEKMMRFYDFSEINEAVHDSETGVCVKAVLKL